MEIVNKYFETLIFTRIEEKKTPEGVSFFIYGAKTQGLFEDGLINYVLLFVPSDLSIKTKARITELPWESLQTRRLKINYKTLPKQMWRPEKGIEDVLLHVVSREKRYSVYKGSAAFPFEILLLHNPRKKTLYQFNNKMALSSAIYTFSLIMKYTGQIPAINYTSRAPNSNYSFPNAPVISVSSQGFSQGNTQGNVQEYTQYNQGMPSNRVPITGVPGYIPGNTPVGTPGPAPASQLDIDDSFELLV